MRPFLRLPVPLIGRLQRMGRPGGNRSKQEEDRGYAPRHPEGLGREPRHSACVLYRSWDSPFSTVEFLTLSSDADPDRYAHMPWHLKNQGHGHSEQFQMNQECAIAGSDFSTPTTAFSARYFNCGDCLEEVFPLHGLGPAGSSFPPTTTIQTQLTDQQRAELLVFLRSIDGDTPHFRSEGDIFRDTVGTEGTCPMPPPS
jgi:hypothetical protein